MDTKIKNLIDFAQGIYKNENGKELYHQYLSDINQVTPQDIFLIENEQLKMGVTPKEMLSFVDKLIHVFHNSLVKYEWKKPEQGTFLFYLQEENKALKTYLETLKVIIKRQNYVKDRDLIVNLLKQLLEYNWHLLKLENILFPYLEKKMERFEGLKIMWSLHDEIRSCFKNLIEKFESEELEEKSLNVDFGVLFFLLHGAVQKQELILFPAATEVLETKEFESMHLQSFDYEFALIAPPKKPDLTMRSSDMSGNGERHNGLIQMETGNLKLEQIESVINALPVDVTFVDENDKVAFFSRPKDRIFPRSVAIIGRDVRNCHPPESVHMVEKIIDDFKQNKKDSERFWIQMKGMFILIEYFAVRNAEGKYLGILEVSQEISQIKELEGEKRLLD